MIFRMGKKTLYVRGFNPKTITKPLIEELFIQAGPIHFINLFKTHAKIVFEHEETVPYSIALLNGIELNGDILRLSPQMSDKNSYCYHKYLMEVRNKLMKEYRKMEPPNLPPKKYPTRQPRPKAQPTVFDKERKTYSWTKDKAKNRLIAAAIEKAKAKRKKKRRKPKLVSKLKKNSK